MSRFIAMGLLLLITNTVIANEGGNDDEKTRLIVLTDIENEPDDAQSLIRFLTYTNQWDVKGLIATTSIWQQNEIADWRIYEILEAYQNDFAARMDWCTKSYEEANHPPRVKTGLPDTLKVKAGEQVELKASGSTDPDGDKLSHHWIYYREAGNSVYSLDMEGENTSAVSFQAPDMGQFPQYMHFVLEVPDNGAPPLTRYDRVVVKVK